MHLGIKVRRCGDDVPVNMLPIRLAVVEVNDVLDKFVELLKRQEKTYVVMKKHKGFVGVIYIFGDLLGGCPHPTPGLHEARFTSIEFLEHGFGVPAPASSKCMVKGNVASQHRADRLQVPNVALDFVNEM